MFTLSELQRPGDCRIVYRPIMETWNITMQNWLKGELYMKDGSNEFRKHGLVGPSLFKGGTFREVASKKIEFDDIEKYMQEPEKNRLQSHTCIGERGESSSLSFKKTPLQVETRTSTR